MDTKTDIATRRRFLRTSTKTALAAFGAAHAISLFGNSKDSPTKGGLDPAALAKKLVTISHSDFDGLKAVLASHPGFANAGWDWGNGAGDWETPLGAASHMGRTDNAALLIDHGARKDIFWASMSGETKLVKAFVDTDPDCVRHSGPHGLSLQFHAATGGHIETAELLLLHGAELDHSTLRGSVSNNHYDMTKWLLEHGIDDLEQTDFKGRTIMDIAQARGDSRLVTLLKQHKTTSH